MKFMKVLKKGVLLVPKPELGDESGVFRVHGVFAVAKKNPRTMAGENSTEEVRKTANPGVYWFRFPYSIYRAMFLVFFINPFKSIG